MMNEMDQPQRRLRSFVRRQGRMTEGQSRAMETLWQDYGLPCQATAFSGWSSCWQLALTIN